MLCIVEGVEGVEMDDVLNWGATQREHDEILWRVLLWLQEAGVNDKYEFSKNRIKFLRQVIETSGVSVDPDKVRAVRAIKMPRNVSKVRWFLVMANHFEKFLPNLADKTCPFRDLLKKSNTWAWARNNSRPLIASRRTWHPQGWHDVDIKGLF